MAKKKRGIYADPRGTPHAHLEDKVADFSYQSEDLAGLIVQIWRGQHGDLLLAPNKTDYLQRSTNAQVLLQGLGFFFRQPIVITEDEYEEGFHLEENGLSVTDGVIFVVPRETRKVAGASLLETAKMLMAITPNGI